MTHRTRWRNVEELDPSEIPALPIHAAPAIWSINISLPPVGRYGDADGGNVNPAKTILVQFDFPN